MARALQYLASQFPSRKTAWLIALFVLAPVCSVSAAGNDSVHSSSNRVRSIDPDALDRLMSDKAYTGFVVFMAAWCPPCKQEMPVLAELYRIYQPRSIQITAVSLDPNGPEAVESLVDEQKLPFQVLWIGKEAILKYRVVGIPMLLVIKKGQIVERIPGAQPRRLLRAKIKALLE